MDELKLNIWKERFLAEAAKASIVKSAYNLSLNESDELTLILSDEVSLEIKEKLKQLLESTKPEDSV